MAWRSTGDKPLSEPMTAKFTDTYICVTKPWIKHHTEAAGYKQESTVQIKYSKTSNIRRTLVGNKIVDHSDVVGASPVGAAPTTSSFST